MHPLTANLSKTLRSTVLRTLRRPLSSSKLYEEQDGQIVLKSPLTDTPFSARNVTHHIFKDVDRWRDRTAIKCALTREEIDYGTLHDEVAKYARGFYEYGLRINDRVVIVLPNGILYAKVTLALNLIGVTAALLNPTYTPSEMEGLIRTCDPKAIITIGPLLETVLKGLDNLQQSKIDIFLDQVDETMPKRISNPLIPLPSLLPSEAPRFPEETPDQLTNYVKTTALLPFSSGTTGPPKGVMISHFNLTSAMDMAAHEKSCSFHKTNVHLRGYQDTMLGILPFFHIFGVLHNLMFSLYYGLRIVTMPKFDWDLFKKTLVEERPSVVNVVPPLVHNMIRDPTFTQDHLASMRCIASGAAPISPSVIRELISTKGRINMEFREAYALTECGMATIQLKGMYKQGSVGMLSSSMKARFRDVETGKDVGPNQQGEILLRGAPVMQGYYQNAEATENALEGKWLRTGDIGYFDEDGDIFIVDRAKDFIKCKGYQVSPTELENVIVEVDEVAEACVIGVPNDETGEAPKAFVVAKKGADEDGVRTKINETVKAQLSDYKQLRGGVEFVEALPKSATGKVLRKELRE